ncbi:MAG: O-antigen ligase family protein, partial [Caldilineaceae bacterium]|nr:O-antigen ligase family protein [Caldilineaceae bacterium]
RPSYLLFKRIAIAFYGVTILQSLIGIGRLARGQATLYLSTGGDRYVSGSASVLIAIGLIISLILLLYVVRGKTNVLLVLTAATLQGIGVLISFNRQTWLAMIIALTMGYVILFGGRRVRILAWAVALLIVIGAGLVTLDRFDIGPVTIQQTLQSRLGAGLTFQEYLREPSMLYRISAWQKALGDIRANPLVGQGWGARFIFVVPLASGMRVYEASPHNTYLWLAAKGGLPTLFFFGALMCVLLADGIRQFHRFRRRHPHHALFLMGTILAQVIFLCGAFWWDYLTVMYLSIPFWLNCGMMAALSSARFRQLLEQNSARPKSPERISTGAYITP